MNSAIYDEREVLKELKKLQVNSSESATRLRRLLKEKSRIKEDIKATMNMHCSEIPKDALPPKEKDPGSFTLPCRIHNMCFDKALADLGASVSIMPYSTFTNLGLDFIVLDILEDIKIPLILGRPFLSTAHAKTDVFKRKIALRMGNDKIVFKSDNPTNSIIKKVYVLGLRERMELDIQARLIGEALILNRSQDPEFEDFLKLNDLNEPLELRNHEMEDLGPTIKEGEVIDEPMIDVVKIRSFYNSIMKEKIEYKGRYVVGAFINVPIFVGNFSIVIDFAVVENMDAYRDKDMGDVIFGKPFCRVVCVHARRFDGFITIHNGDDSVTYQMARSHPREVLKREYEEMNDLLRLAEVVWSFRRDNGSEIRPQGWRRSFDVVEKRESVVASLGTLLVSITNADSVDWIVGVGRIARGCQNGRVTELVKRDGEGFERRFGMRSDMRPVEEFAGWARVLTSLEFIALELLSGRSVNTIYSKGLDYAAGRNLKGLNGKEAWETIEDCAQCHKHPKEVPSFNETKPQPQPLPNYPPLDISLGNKRGPEPPIKPHSPDSFKMKAVDHFTVHMSPSPHVAYFHPKDTYCYYHPWIDDPKKHYGFKPGILGQSRSLCVNLLNIEVIEWELESKEVSFLGRGLNSPFRPKEVEKVIFDEMKLRSS
ncbi:hypothetical protein Tco_0186106 [Tanacetum coccineum]